jgi:hypothetical protein
MPTISEYGIISLSGGEIVSGMTLVLTAQMIWSHGFHFNIFHDKKRQILLNNVMFLAAINGILAYPFNASLSSVWASNITTLLSFAFVQFGLVVLNHNSIARFNAYCNIINPSLLKWICLILYLLPFAVFIPIYLSAAEQVPRGQLINTSHFNKLIFKPMTLSLILTTELLATISDIFLLRSVLKIKDQLLSHTANIPQKNANRINSVSLDLLCNYIFTWFFLLFDIAVKIGIILGYPILFDSIISILTIALRARSNILYGLNMSNIFQRSRTGQSSSSSNRSAHYPPSPSPRSVGKAFVF